MHHRHPVEVLEPLDELVEVGPPELLPERSLLQHLEQVVARQVLQDQSQPLVLLATALGVELVGARVDVAHEVRVVECGGCRSP